MNHNVFSLLTFLFLLSACQESKPTDLDFEEEINALTTVDLQRDYIEEMFRLDQKCRTNETESMTKYGHDSPEHKASWDIIREVDEANLIKLNLYLDKYGHPTRRQHGTLAAGALSVIIHHSSSESSARHDHFHHLYRAYRNGDINDTSFTFYMNRWYDFAYGERLKLKSPFRVETEVDTLIKSMNMQEVRLEIDKELGLTFNLIKE